MEKTAQQDKIQIIEVCMRDGLQAEEMVLSSSQKIRMIEAITAAGVKAVEVTSFVRPDVIPQLADAKEVMLGIKRAPGVIYSALVPNLKGAERALECRVDEWGLLVSMSEEHSRRNTGFTKQKAIDEARRIIALGKENHVRLNGGVLTAFGGDGQEERSLADISEMTELYLDMGIQMINVADTEGIASPAEIYTVMHRLIKRYPQAGFVLHLHDTTHRALANAMAGLMAGVKIFDCALGGLGGCPAVPHAGGNLDTEAFLRVLHSLGLETGIDLTALKRARSLLLSELGRL